MSVLSDQLSASWLSVLRGEFDQPYMKALEAFLMKEEQAGKAIYPPRGSIFSAFNLTPFNNVNVVILGQDPYHGEGQAHGLSFSVPEGISPPPSLRNMFKELNRDLGLHLSQNGCLESWAEQGVLLLNATLTVAKASAGSHQKKGWEEFTDEVIRQLNEGREGVVFLLWGSYAQKKGAMIDHDRHCVLESPHPSPLSAHRGFLGNNHFSKTNQYLQEQGKEPINWALPSAAGSLDLG